MDIARVGVALDPKPFTDGESAVIAALKRIEDAVRREGRTIESESKKSSGSFGQMAGAARNAASTMRSAFDGMANSVGMISPKLGFLLQTLRGFSAMVGGMASSLRSVASGANAAGAGFRGMAVAVGSAVAVIGTLTVVLAGVLAVLAPIIIAVKAVGFAWDAFKTGLGQAAEFESMTTRFAGMLGSMEKAEERMKSLSKFADTTPFELPEIVKASMALENMTQGLWSSEKALTLVGNAAAKSKVPIDELAERMGSVFNAVMFGGEWREKVQTLAAQGAIGGDVANRMKDAIEQGKTLREVWKIAEDSLKSYGDQMKNLSTDFEGQSSTMADAWGKFIRTLGEAILPAAKDVVIDITDAFTRLAAKAKEMKPQLMQLADTIVGTFKVMTQPGGFDLVMRAAGEKLEAAINEGWAASSAKILKWINETFGVDLKAQVENIKNADIWKSLETDIIPRIGTALGNAIWNAIAAQFEKLGGAFAGMMTKATGGANLKVGEYLGGKVDQAGQMYGGMLDSARATVENWRAPNLPGVVSTTDQANQFVGDLALGGDGSDFRGAGSGPEFPFTADGGGTYPADGASGVDLLQPFEDNTKATRELTKTITESMFGAKKGGSSSGIMLPEAPSGALLTQVPKTASEELADRLELQRIERDAQRLATQAGKTFPKPNDLTAAWDQPTGTYQRQKKEDDEKAAEKASKEAEAAAKRFKAEGDRMTESLRTPLEEHDDMVAKLQEMQKAGQISTETMTRGIAKAKDDYENAVDAMAKAAKKSAKEQESAVGQLMKQWGDLAKNIDQANANIAQSFSTNITGALVAMADGTKSAKQAFADMAKGIVNDILKIITQMMVQYALQQAMGLISGTGGFTGAVMAGVKHDGGTVGGGGPSRGADPSVFRGAERFHQGGMTGLAPGEVPIIAEKGETVMTEDQQAAIKNRLRAAEAPAKTGGQTVNILNVTDPKQIEEAILRDPNLILNAISRKLPQLRTMLKQS